MKTYFVGDVLEELGIKWIWWFGENLEKGESQEEGPVVFGFISCCRKIVPCTLT